MSRVGIPIALVVGVVLGGLVVAVHDRVHEPKAPQPFVLDSRVESTPQDVLEDPSREIEQLREEKAGLVRRLEEMERELGAARQEHFSNSLREFVDGMASAEGTERVRQFWRVALAGGSDSRNETLQELFNGYLDLLGLAAFMTAVSLGEDGVGMLEHYFLHEVGPEELSSEGLLPLALVCTKRGFEAVCNIADAREVSEEDFLDGIRMQMLVLATEDVQDRFPQIRGTLREQLQRGNPGSAAMVVLSSLAFQHEDAQAYAMVREARNWERLDEDSLRVAALAQTHQARQFVADVARRHPVPGVREFAGALLETWRD